MFRRFALLIIITGSLSLTLFNPEPSSAQQESIASDHVRLTVPAERGSVGRAVIGNIERFYMYVNRATRSSLPDKINITVRWDVSESQCFWSGASITVGMKQPPATANLSAFLFHSAAREIARMGLQWLSDGAQREDTVFLFEGMIEILVHEFDYSSRQLESTWALSKLLDEMQLLGLTAQRSWSTFSDGTCCHRNAAPGITFLTTFRELQTRDRPMKLFEALKKKSLAGSMSEAFKASPAELESIWLKRIREYTIVDEITTVAEDAPQLRKTVLVPDTGKPGENLQIQLFIADRARNLLPNSVFIKDERTGRITNAQESSENDIEFLMTTIAIDPDCPSGKYGYQVIAIDEVGNLRRWKGSYPVAGE